MKKCFSVLLSVLLIASCTVGFSGCSKNKTADTVIYGHFYTSEADITIAEAVAIKDGKFIYVGDAEGAKAYVGKATAVETYDSDKLITAGLVDAHTHVEQLMVAKSEALGSISNGASKETCIAEITQYVADNPDLDWYVLSGWEMQNFADEAYGCPTADMLDGISEKPILAVSSDGHSYWINNALMDLAAITKDTTCADGGVIMTDEDGNPLGVLKDTAEYIIDDLRPDMSAEIYAAGIQQADALCISQGYVYRFDAMTNKQCNALKYPLVTNLEAMDDKGELKTYTQGSFVIGNVDNAVDLVDEAIKLRKETKGGNFELTNVKIFLDGIVENAGAYLSEPYAYDNTAIGSQRWVGEDALVKMGHVIAKANKAGMPVHFHAMGDQATSDILTAIAYAAEEVGKEVVQKARNAITHLALVKESDYARFAEYNVIAVFNPWCVKDPGYYDLQVMLLGRTRADNQYPMQSTIDAGIKYAFGTDLGASFTYNSVECFHALTTRTYNNDDPSTLLKESEKLSREEALNAMTVGGAYQLMREDSIGSVAVGKEASLVVFSKDLLTVADTEIMSAEVEKTMYQGTWLN